MSNLFQLERIGPNGEWEPWLSLALEDTWGEIVLVVAVIIGFSTTASSLLAWHGSSHKYLGLLLTNEQMVSSLAQKSAILGLLFIYLHRQEWRPKDLRIRPTWRSSGRGLLLVLGMFIANFITVVVGYLIAFHMQSQYENPAAFIAANQQHLKFHSVNVSWLAMIPALVLNGFFEEITCMGYAFNQFATKHGPLFALFMTVVLRMSCHTYQSAVHAFGIGASFFVSGLVYCWTRNLWPLILAHIIVDLGSFGAIKFFYG